MQVLPWWQLPDSPDSLIFMLEDDCLKKKKKKTLKKHTLKNDFLSYFVLLYFNSFINSLKVL